MERETIFEQLCWLYAHIGMAQYALSKDIKKYDRTCFSVRMHLYKGLTAGTMHIRSFFDDEKDKITLGSKCIYCGSETNISIDHILPKYYGGSDNPENLVCACRNCNSSKGKRDMVQWFIENGILNERIDAVEDSLFPFCLKSLQIRFPAQTELKWWG